MIFILEFLISLLVFVFGFFVLRLIGIQNATVDWIFLILCALIPLYSKRIRINGIIYIALLVFLNVIVMFYSAFYIIAIFFKDGL
jgi:hypothetical protein